jgi:hypothetical protein
MFLVCALADISGETTKAKRHKHKNTFAVRFINLPLLDFLEELFIDTAMIGNCLTFVENFRLTAYYF